MPVSSDRPRPETDRPDPYAHRPEAAQPWAPPVSTPEGTPGPQVGGRPSGRGRTLAIVGGTVAVLLVATITAGLWLAGPGRSSPSASWPLAPAPADTEVPSTDPMPAPADDPLDRQDTGIPLTDEERALVVELPTRSPGQPADLLTSSVTVTGVYGNADAVIQDMNEHNPEAAFGYVLVGLEVYNRSDTTISMGDGFEVNLVTNDQMRYEERCAASVLPGGSSADPGELPPGGTTGFQACFDVPEQRLGEVKVMITDTEDDDAAPTLWESR